MVGSLQLPSNLTESSFSLEHFEGKKLFFVVLTEGVEEGLFVFFMQIEMLAPVLISRTGRHLQRYDKGCRLVVGCIPYRVHGPEIKDIEVLLITSQKSPRLMFPKGGWELDENIELAASRETLEEAGVRGLLGEKLGEWTFKSKSQEKFHMGSMFPLLVTEVLDVWPEKDNRKRTWMTVIQAREACTQSWMKEALEAFVCQLTHLPTADGGHLPTLCRTEDLKLCISSNY